MPAECKMDFSFWIDNQEFKVGLEERGENNIQVNLGGRTYNISAEILGDEELLLNIDGRVYNIIISSNTSSSYSICVGGRFFEVEKKSISQMLTVQARKAKKQVVRASMPGRIIKVLLREGKRVKENQAVMVLEAMKMQNEIKSPQAGIITKIGVSPGDSVETGFLLFSVE